MREFPLEYAKQKPARLFPEHSSYEQSDFLEIGPGNGQFLLTLAQKHNGKEIVAIELDSTRYKKLVRRVTRAELNNVKIIGGNARVMVSRFLSFCQFERIYILFPDPWPKRRYAPNRLISIEFLLELSGLLRADGTLYMATDVRVYAESMVDCLARINTLELIGNPFCAPDEIADYKPTFFENLATRDGVNSRYLVARKLPSTSSD